MLVAARGTDRIHADVCFARVVAALTNIGVGSIRSRRRLIHYHCGQISWPIGAEGKVAVTEPVEEAHEKKLCFLECNGSAQPVDLEGRTHLRENYASVCPPVHGSEELLKAGIGLKRNGGEDTLTGKLCVCPSVGPENWNRAGAEVRSRACLDGEDTL